MAHDESPLDGPLLDGPLLDMDVVRSHFPAFTSPGNAGQSFFENAGGSFACRQTIDALTGYYTDTKVQPYADYGPSADAGAAMDHSRRRWAEALGVEAREVVFGPSTSMNTYVLAHAFGEIIEPGAEVVVTNQDHEANTGAIRRIAERTSCTLREWRIDPVTGRLDLADLHDLLGDRTRLVTVPHASNIVGEENPIPEICSAAHAVGARVIVDGVSYAPHSFPDVDALHADVYLFSLYKTYSVHQGLMVVRSGLLAELPNQGHYFNAGVADKRLNPAGPDHAQVAASGAVLDYVEVLDRQLHGGPGDDLPGDDLRGDDLPGDDLSGGLRGAVARTSRAWRAHENALTPAILDHLAARDDVRLLGPLATGKDLHRCPTIAFSPLAVEPADVARGLVERGIQTSSGHYYAVRLLEGLGLDPDRGIVRLSFVHYTSPNDVERALAALDEVLGR